MKTIVEALKDLYVAMGGESSDVSGLSLNPDVIEQIAELVESGETKELPAVTAEDNDKVLAVVNGAWDKAESGGGSGGVEVVVARIEVSNYDSSSSSYTVVNSNYTKDELIAIADNGGMIFANIYQVMGGSEAPLMRRGVLEGWSNDGIDFTTAKFTYNGTNFVPQVISCNWNYEGKMGYIQA